jgi:alpha-amylase/alpha-mannosidase (GH57 family)
MVEIYYALGLHMHQPPGNLKLLIEANEWEAQQIIKCYERAARYAHKFKGVAYFHVGFSGILLEQFKNPEIIDKYRKFVDIPKMIQLYRQAKNIEIIGMGFYHPIFPLIPHDDWAEQLEQGREIAEELFGQKPKGFWPSEMAFSMEMIPFIKKAGYEYVVVDHVHVKPVHKVNKPDCFKPYKACYDGVDITVIPRNRDISNAQESGMDPHWFLNEANHKMKGYPSSEQVRLITTWSDGENGGWFRQIDEDAGFFGYFFAPLMEMMKDKKTDIRTIKISDFLKKYPAIGEATVETGAWNIASKSGYDFSQWDGSDSQKRAIEGLFKTSRKYWELKRSLHELSDVKNEQLKRARRLILNAETSCYLFWGDAWIPKIYDKLNEANRLLNKL